MEEYIGYDDSGWSPAADYGAVSVHDEFTTDPRQIWTEEVVENSYVCCRGYMSVA